MTLVRIVGRALQLNADPRVESHEILELLRNESSLSAECGPREGENSLVLFGLLSARSKKSREDDEYESWPAPS
jgi:hypothetical protein